MRRRPVDSAGDEAPLFSLDGSSGGGGGTYPTVTAPPSSAYGSSSRSSGRPQRKLQHHGSIQAFNVRETQTGSHRVADTEWEREIAGVQIIRRGSPYVLCRSLRTAHTFMHCYCCCCCISAVVYQIVGCWSHFRSEIGQSEQDKWHHGWSRILHSTFFPPRSEDNRRMPTGADFTLDFYCCSPTTWTEDQVAINISHSSLLKALGQTAVVTIQQ